MEWISGGRATNDRTALWRVRGCSSHPASSIGSDRCHDRCRDCDDGDGRRGRFSANAPHCGPANAVDCAASAVGCAANGPANAASAAAYEKRYGHHDCVIGIWRSDVSAVGSCRERGKKGEISSAAPLPKSENEPLLAESLSYQFVEQRKIVSDERRLYRDGSVVLVDRE